MNTVPLLHALAADERGHELYGTQIARDAQPFVDSVYPLIVGLCAYRGKEAIDGMGQ